MLSFLNVLLVVSSMQAVQPVIVKTPELEIEFTPRTANQMGSFYEARGFPKVMLDTLKQQCFITVGITNKSDKKIWLDLSDWEFSSKGKPIKRETLAYRLLLIAYSSVLSVFRQHWMMLQAKRRVRCSRLSLTMYSSRL